MSATGMLVFKHGNDVKLAIDPNGNLFVKQDIISSAEGHSGLVLKSSQKINPSISIKASSSDDRVGNLVVDTAIEDANLIAEEVEPVLVFRKGNLNNLEFGYVQNSGRLRARGKIIRKFATRKDAARITKIERDNLRDAFIELQRKAYPGSRNDPIPGGVPFWFKQDEIHQATHVHSFPPYRGIAFLPWHRELVNRLEALLREVDPTVSLHYWDWKTDPANSNGVNLMTSDFMGAANGEIGEPWLSAGFYVPGANPHRDISVNPFDPPTTITRDKRSGSPGVDSDDEASVVNEEAFPEMRKKLEDLHDSVHGYIGGTIGSAHTSFRDPFVFLLHANVDRIWASWQLKAGKEWRLNPELVYGSESNTDVTPVPVIYDPGILTPLDPWAGNPNNHPEVSRIRPWAPPENQQFSKNSKHPSVVYPSLYETYV